MSDKFFFKGRQDARQSHIKYGYETKGKHKLGSKKYPLELVVTSEKRKTEVEALAAEADLYVVVQLDTSEDAVESITGLTTLLDKKSTIKTDSTPSRNEPCSCGSGKKYKKCCG
ncbi:MAG: SEC-C metal-binding domain-containing protein [Motiliproteus sp.]|nr:SEC-C metal-binding domain-containing protein [Motiliproteus sp.]